MQEQNIGWAKCSDRTPSPDDREYNVVALNVLGDRWVTTLQYGYAKDFAGGFDGPEWYFVDDDDAWAIGTGSSSISEISHWAELSPLPAEN